MRILRLAYTAEFLIALIAVFAVWSEVGGQGHLDMMAWYVKLPLGAGAAYAAVRATAAAVARDRAWNGASVKWLGILLALLIGCGIATYYYHLQEYEDEDEQDDEITSFEDRPGVSGRHNSARFAAGGLTTPAPGGMRDYPWRIEGIRMRTGARIRAFAPRCPQRKELGSKLAAAIAEVYACRAAWERAQAAGKDVTAAFSVLQRARENQLAVQHAYSEHVREHRCLSAAVERAAAADAAE